MLPLFPFARLSSLLAHYPALHWRYHVSLTRFVVRDPRPGGRTTLHTGDFRADASVCRNPAVMCLKGKLDTLYLDTTYCGPRHTFPDQHEVSLRLLGEGGGGGWHRFMSDYSLLNSKLAVRRL